MPADGLARLLAGWTMPRSLLFVIGSTIVSLPGATATARPSLLQVRSQTFDIEYETNPAAMPLEHVELWLTRDSGSSWSLATTDPDRQSPIQFHAEAQGPHGFFVVLVNATGASSERPKGGTAPQFEAFIDFVPPVIQLHPPTMATSLGQRTVQIRWTAIDAHFDSRPIRIEYQAPGQPWQPAATEPLANTGRFDWRVSDNLVGSVNLRVSTEDLGGNQATSDIITVDLADAHPARPNDAAADPTMQGPSSSDTLLLGSSRARQRVSELLSRAAVYEDRGQWAEAIASLREAVKLDPTCVNAFVQLGALLLKADDPQRAVEAYELALKLDARDRAALLGASLALRHRRDYSASADRLRTLLRHRPDDAEAWLALGDVAVFQGDELLARECYLRASRIDHKAVTIIEDARQRLALMQESARQNSLSDTPSRQAAVNGSGGQ